MNALRWSAATVLAASAFTGAALAAAPVNGDALREQLPPPGESAPPSTRQFAGLEHTGTYAIAVVVHRNGDALAFVCNGKRRWRWLTGRLRGDRLLLTGDRGARLTGSVHAGRVMGTVRLAGRARFFSLPRSSRRLGLRRFKDGRFEAAWIATNAGQIRGVGTLGKTTVISASADDTASTADEGTTAAGDDPVPARLFNKARCAIIQVKADIIRLRQARGTATPEDSNELIQLDIRFDQLDCDTALAS